MAPQPTTTSEMLGREQTLLDRLLVLYTQEQRVYREVLELAGRGRSLPAAVPSNRYAACSNARTPVSKRSATWKVPNSKPRRPGKRAETAGARQPGHGCTRRCRRSVN